MSTLKVFNTPGGYHDKCGCEVIWKPLNLYGNPSVLNIPPQCTHDIPYTHHGLPHLSSYLPSQFVKGKGFFWTGSGIPLPSNGPKNGPLNARLLT